MNVRIFWVCEIEYMCAQTKPWFILSSKEFWWHGIRTHLNSMAKIPSTGKILLRGSNPRCCIMQDSKPNTLPMSYSDPRQHLPMQRAEDDVCKAYQRGFFLEVLKSSVKAIGTKVVSNGLVSENKKSVIIIQTSLPNVKITAQCISLPNKYYVTKYIHPCLSMRCQFYSDQVSTLHA